MMRARYPYYPAPMLRTLPLMLAVSLTCTPVLAQMRVNRNLNARSAGALSLPAPVMPPVAPAAATSAPLPAADQISRTRPSGSYASVAMGATIVAKNADYETTFRIDLPVPAGSTISKVWWRYGLSHKPIGFEAVLCWNNQQPCWNMTNNASGSTVAFNGKDATRPFTLHYRVQGGGQLGPPAQGEMNQLIVTYDLPD